MASRRTRGRSCADCSVEFSSRHSSSAGCDELQSILTKAKVKHLIAANKLLQKVHLEADRRMHIHKI